MCDCCLSVRIFSFVRCLFHFNHIIFAWSYICCYFSLFFSRWLYTHFFPTSSLCFYFQCVVCSGCNNIFVLFFILLLLYWLRLWLVLNIHFFFFLLILLFFHTRNRQTQPSKSSTHIHSSHAVKIQLSHTQKKKKRPRYIASRRHRRMNHNNPKGMKEKNYTHKYCLHFYIYTIFFASFCW